MGKRSRRNRNRLTPPKHIVSLNNIKISDLLETQKNILETSIRKWIMFGKLGKISDIVAERSLITAASVLERSMSEVLKIIENCKIGNGSIDEIYSSVNQIKSDASRQKKEMEINVDKKIYGSKSYVTY